MCKGVKEGRVKAGGIFRKCKNSGVTGLEEAWRVGSWRWCMKPAGRIVPDGEGLGSCAQEPGLDPESNREPVEVWG